MATMYIRIGRNSSDDRGAQIIVDGVDVTKSVLAEGFAIDVINDPMPHAVVSMRLRVNHLDMDLPEAVLNLIETTEV